MDNIHLTDMSKVALAKSRNEALFFQQEQIQPEHLLTALAGIPRCLAARLLRELGHDLHIVVREVVTFITFGPSRARLPTPEFSAATLRVLERAGEEARALSAERIGTEHLLLGLLGHDSLACSVLTERLGVQADEVRRLVKSWARKSSREST